MKIFISGASGFIGYNLLGYFRTRGHEILGTARPHSRSWRQNCTYSHSGIQLHNIDLANCAAVKQLVLNYKPDVIFHVASHGAYSWQTDFEAMLKINAELTASLLDAAEELNCNLVYAGSSSEYGFQQRAISETTTPEPNSLYAVSKNAGSNLVAHYSREGRVRALVLRLFSVFGPWEEPNRLIPKLLANALSGSLPPLVSPDIARDFVYIQDVCRAFESTLEASPREDSYVFNIGSGVQTSLKELVATVSRLYSLSIEPDWGSMSPRQWDTTSWRAEIDLAHDVLGWSPKVTLDQGLVETGRWLDDNNLLDSFR